MTDFASALKGLPQRCLKKLASLRDSNRPAHTLVCVTPAETVRLDADADGRAVGEPLSQPCDSADAAKLAEAVSMALAVGPKPGRKLWVLYEGLTVHALLTPAAQVAGMDEAMLEQALRFELDGNGITVRPDYPMAVALVGSEDAMNSYALCFAPGGALDALRCVASRQGAALAGLGHPGGLPLSLTGSTESWMRLEHWGETVLGVAGNAQSQRWWSVFHSGVNGAQYQRELARWRKTLKEPYSEENLFWRDMPFDGDLPNRSIWLNQPDDRRRWLEAWLAEIATSEHRALWLLPLLRPPAFRLPEPAIMAVAGVLALAVCLGHYSWFSHQATLARNEAVKLKKIESDMKTQQEAIRKSEEERDKLQKISRLQLENRDAIPRVMRNLKERHARLLQQVAIHRPDQVVLEHINAAKEGAEVEGVTLDSYQVDKLAEMLAAPLAALGWRVEPPLRDDLKTFSSGGPWRFVIKLTDSGLDAFAKPASTEAKP